jgi:hypothetical protein
MYVSIKPAIILESDPTSDKSEKESQENRYTYLNMGESFPGKLQKID